MNIPDKLYFSIGEVGSLTKLEPYTLRYWEAEFPLLTPKKNKAGKRVYTRKNVENILYIKKLLYQERYTIEGAKKKLRTTGYEQKKEEIFPERRQNKEISNFFKDMKEDLVLLKNFIEYNCL